MMDVFHTLPYQQTKGEQCCSTAPPFFVGKVGDGWPRKNKPFQKKIKKIKKQKTKKNQPAVNEQKH